MTTRKRGLETRGLLMGFIIAAHKGRYLRLCIPRYSLVTSQAKSFATETRHPQSAPCAAFYRGWLQLLSCPQMPCRMDWCSGPNDVIYSPKPTRSQKCHCARKRSLLHSSRLSTTHLHEYIIVQAPMPDSLLSEKASQCHVHWWLEAETHPQASLSGVLSTATPEGKPGRLKLPQEPHTRYIPV